MNKILFSIGFLLLLTPLVLQWNNKGQQEKIISSYWEKIEMLDDEEIEETFHCAQIYNESLIKESDVFEGEYEALLNLSGNGIMGSIEIPDISLKLPIYHGTSDEVLASGVGHLQDSSLPIGGMSTHAILTGHRGLPGAQLFTRLDEMEKGDVFFIRVCNQVLTYQVVQIQVIEPDEVEIVDIQEGKDLISLITCTPYGINTHRLVVTGERTENQAVSEFDGSVINMSKWDFILILILVLFLVMIVLKKRRAKEVKR